VSQHTGGAVIDEIRQKDSFRISSTAFREGFLAWVTVLVVNKGSFWFSPLEWPASTM
jgi:hypothetical protein